MSAQRASWSIPGAAWSIQTTGQEQNSSILTIFINFSISHPFCPVPVALRAAEEFLPQHGADSQDQPQPQPHCAARSQLKKPTYFHLQKPSRSLLENGLGGEAAYYLLSGKEAELPPKLSVLSVHMRMVIHPARRQLG